MIAMSIPLIHQVLCMDMLEIRIMLEVNKQYDWI